MVSLASLWLPIILAAVIVFFASSILHMVLKWHRGDFKKIPNEASVMDAMRAAGIEPGMYMFPHCEPKDQKSPEAQEKFKRGPVGILSVMPSGAMNMGKYLGLWFLYCLIVSFFVGYLTSRTVAPGMEYLAVFRVAGTVAFMGYAMGHMVDSIWHAQPWGVTFRHIIDGLIYALLTAGVFGWLWMR